MQILHLLDFSFKPCSSQDSNYGYGYGYCYDFVEGPVCKRTTEISWPSGPHRYFPSSPGYQGTLPVSATEAWGWWFEACSLGVALVLPCRQGLWSYWSCEPLKVLAKFCIWPLAWIVQTTALTQQFPQGFFYSHHGSSLQLPAAHLRSLQVFLGPFHTAEEKRGFQGTSVTFSQCRWLLFAWDYLYVSFQSSNQGVQHRVPVFQVPRTSQRLPFWGSQNLISCLPPWPPSFFSFPLCPGLDGDGPSTSCQCLLAHSLLSGSSSPEQQVVPPSYLFQLWKELTIWASQA